MKVNAKRKPLMSAILLLTSLGVTTSCLDSSYDLKKDIDMTINVGGQYLAFPVGSTEKITLDKIIEVKDGDDLQLKDGAYHLIRKDDIAESTTQIGLAEMDATVVSIGAITVVNPLEFPAVADFTQKDLTTDGNIKIKISDIDETVKEIGSLTAKDNVVLSINFKLSGDLIYNQASFENLKIVLPKFLQFKPKEGLTGNIYTIPNQPIDKVSGLNIQFEVTGFSFGTKPGEGKKIEAGSFSLNEAVTVATDVKITSIDLNHKSSSLSITPTLTLGAMAINSITGTIQPKIEVDPTDIKLSNLPDFLQDDEVNLDITNPIISFKANNPLKADIELDGVMTGYKNDRVTKVVKIGSAHGESPIVLKPSGTNQQTISLTRTAVNIEGATNVVVPKLNDIIETIPDRITVELTPSIKTNDYYTVDLGKDYALKSSYEIDIPLSFGSKMQIVYKDSVDGFRSDLEDIEFKKVAIALTADNAIPLKLEIKDSNVTPKDVDGKKVDDVKVTVTGIIGESKNGVTASTSELTIAIEETKEGAMNKVDGITFKVTAVPGQATNVQLRSTQWLQLREIKLRVPNGVKVDLN